MPGSEKNSYHSKLCLKSLHDRDSTPQKNKNDKKGELKAPKMHDIKMDETGS